LRVHASMAHSVVASVGHLVASVVVMSWKRLLGRRLVLLCVVARGDGVKSDPSTYRCRDGQYCSGPDHDRHGDRPFEK
jgi:hypothetical protein